MNYFKESFRRGLIGILMGLFLSHTLFLIAALGQDTMTVQSSMYISHYFIYGISGFYFAAISILFNIEEWSLLRQFITHICLTLPFLPIAHYIGIMPNNTLGRLSFIGFYLSGYIISFIIYMFHLKKQAKAINSAL